MGPLKFPTSVSLSTRFAMNVPFGLKTCTRSLPVSATRMAFCDDPSASLYTPAGAESCPSPVPLSPNPKANVPFG